MKTEDEMKFDESTTSSTITTTTEINNSCTAADHYSDIENSWNDRMNNSQQRVNSHLKYV